MRYVTNTTRLPRSALARRLEAMGLEVREGELFTAVSAAAAWCRSEEKESVLPLIAPEALEDLEGLRVRTIEELGHDLRGAAAQGNGSSPVDVVLVGDLGASWSYDALNVAFRCLLAGAQLVACQKNRYWKTAEGLALDAGPFVAALEYASGTEAVVVGKPSPAFFRGAIADLGIEPREAVMVGDDAEADAGGAIAAGLGGWLVKTGKYRPGDETRARPWPECVLDSVADVPEALGLPPPG